MYVFNASARLRRIVLISGVGRVDHHLTHVVLSYSTAPDPQLSDEDSWLALPVALDPCASHGAQEHVRVVERGRVMMDSGIVEVMLQCDYVAATALRLIVLGSDADNGNAVVTEVAVWAVS